MFTDHKGRGIIKVVCAVCYPATSEGKSYAWITVFKPKSCLFYRELCDVTPSITELLVDLSGESDSQHWLKIRSCLPNVLCFANKKEWRLIKDLSRLVGVGTEQKKKIIIDVGMRSHFRKCAQVIFHHLLADGASACNVGRPQIREARAIGQTQCSNGTTALFSLVAVH